MYIAHLPCINLKAKLYMVRTAVHTVGRVTDVYIEYRMQCMLSQLTLMVYTILGVHSYINQLWWMGSHNAISIAARA